MARPSSAFSFQLPRLSWAVKVLLWCTVGVSLAIAGAGAFGLGRLEALLFEALINQPRSLRVWTLFTYAFFNDQPLTLAFNCIWIVWLGGDLGSRWGQKRMLLHYFLSVALGGAAVTGLSLLAPSVVPPLLIGGWTTVLPLLMGYALVLPDRPVQMFLVPPFAARLLVPITTGLIALSALYDKSIRGVVTALFVQLAAVALARVKLPGVRLGDPLLRLRVWWFHRRLKGKLRVVPGLPPDEELPKPRSGGRGSDQYLH
jgi:membrane associated rhomboid family serine protease